MQFKKLQILAEIFGEYYRSNDEYLFSCPFCKHYKRKLSINISKNTYKCWVCDSRGRDLCYLVKRFGNHYNKQAWQSFTPQVEISDFDNLFKEQTEIEEEQRIQLPAEYACLANASVATRATSAVNYLKERKIAKEDILKWRIGYCNSGEYKNRIIIPSFNEDGYCNYFIARSYTEDWMKYKNPPVSKNIVFNELMVDWSQPVVLVEGVFDAMRVDNSIPLLGSTLNTNSKLFTAVLTHSKQIYVALDKDAQKKALNIINSLILHGIEVWNIDTGGFEDIGEMTKEQFLERKEEAVFMSNENYILYEALTV